MYFLTEIIQLSQWLFIFGIIFLVIISPVIVLTYYVKRKSHNFGLKNKIMAKLVFLIILLMLTLIYLWGLLFLKNNISEGITFLKLSKYEPAIEYLQTYKNKNGKYPEKLDFNKYVKKGYQYQTYETKDNFQEYIIKVSKYEYVHSYNYCSNPKYEECYPHRDSSLVFEQFGKWIEFENLD